jgi:hypothetical protein
MAEDVKQYRRSVTPGAPNSNRAQTMLQKLRCDPLGRLVMQLAEIDNEIATIRGDLKPSRMVIATLMALKFNVLKELLPYAYSKVPADKESDGSVRMPITINIDGAEILREEEGLIEQVNDALEEARVEFPQYNQDKTLQPVNFMVGGR